MAIDSRFRPTLLCPLEFERRVLADRFVRRHRSDAPLRSDLAVCGPGATGVRRWFERIASPTPPPGGVLLVGTAGGLDPGLVAGRAIVAERVVDPDGREWSPTLAAPPDVRSGPILSLDEALTSPEAKRRIHRTSGAIAVDLESAAFAECCDARGWSWSVVRGISDAADHPLPPQVADWIDPEGGLRSLALLASLVRTPRTIALLPPLQRRSIVALHAVAETVAAWPPSPAARIDGSSSMARSR